ncbi:hypothetical protein [Xanthobacter oligotrophicus]|uniref:hypothetical protein n=1 Tax=Xanthobacter oligotrophicus TaxID=2607286 RepID=UPI0011F3F6BF|nr:hypothetical protein [Xanthobacter oligotrophicus]MCG5233909.1 hypothetical protein [Xanthobacter oligotrophicus]
MQIRFSAERRRAAALFIVVFAAGLLCGCASQAESPGWPEKFEAAKARNRAERSLSEWVEVQPEDLKGVNPDRLKPEGAALAVVRIIRETPDDERLSGTSRSAIREASTNQVKNILIQNKGTESEVGWGVITLPPGNYLPLSTRVGRRYRLRSDGALFLEVVAPNGFGDLPAEKAVPLRSGDVVYLGTLVAVAPNASARVEQVIVRDERAEAAKWMKAHLPAFAPKLQTRLLPSIDHLQ